MTNEEKAVEIHEQIKQWQNQVNNLQDMIEAAWNRVDDLDPEFYAKLFKTK